MSHFEWPRWLVRNIVISYHYRFAEIVKQLRVEMIDDNRLPSVLKKINNTKITQRYGKS